jgi:DNA-binding response OmpR family regulator
VFDAETAIELCESVAPDYAIIDLATPDVDGIALARRLRNGMLRIVAIADKLHSLDAAIDAAVPRPATITRLMDALGAVHIRPER